MFLLAIKAESTSWYHKVLTDSPESENLKNTYFLKSFATFSISVPFMKKNESIKQTIFESLSKYLQKLFEIDLGDLPEDPREPLGTPLGVPWESLGSLLEASWEPLGSLLGAFWCHLDPPWILLKTVE